MVAWSLALVVELITPDDNSCRKSFAQFGAFSDVAILSQLLVSTDLIFLNSLRINFWRSWFYGSGDVVYVIKLLWCPVFKIVIFSSPGHRPCALLSWVSIRRPSVSFSHLNLLSWNRWTDFNQTCQKCSLDGPLPYLCFWCWFEIQHGCQGP